MSSASSSRSLTERYVANLCNNDRRLSFGFAQREIIKRWAEDGLRNGSLEFSKSAWASRPHIVLKPPSDQTAETALMKDCKLRICGDYRMVNTQIEKLAPNLPTGIHQLEQAAGY
jgi:hypothetical protein